MTQDEIIEMAVQAGMAKEIAEVNIDIVEAFAKLVAAHTLMNTDPKSFMSYQEGFEAGQVAMREACAKLCDELHYEVDVYGAQCAAAIRARGQA